MSARVLTYPSEGVRNGGRANCEGNLIVYEGQVFPNTSGKMYQVVRFLGQGHFGQVFLVYEQTEGKQFAMKIAKCGMQFMLSAQTEVQTFKQLAMCLTPEEHKNIVRLFDAFMTQNHIVMILELLGMDLCAVMKVRQNKGLPLNLIRNTISDIAHALFSLHKFELIHADVKPENVLLASQTSANVKLADIGGVIIKNMAAEGMYAVTRYYRPPEVVLGCKLTTKVDIWSLGCLALELFIGNPLFAADNSMKLLHLITKYIGPLPAELIDLSIHHDMYFDDNDNLLPETLFCRRQGIDLSRSWDVVSPSIQNLKEIFQPDLNPENASLYDLVSHTIDVNPDTRYSAQDVLNHKFITDGI